MFVKLDKREDAGYTVSLEWHRETGETRIVVPVAVGAVIGAGVFSFHERHHRRARNAYSPEAVDRTAIFVAPRGGAALT